MLSHTYAGREGGRQVTYLKHLHGSEADTDLFSTSWDKNTQSVTLKEQTHLLAVQLSFCSPIAASPTMCSCVSHVHACVCVCARVRDSSCESLNSYSSDRMLSSPQHGTDMWQQSTVCSAWVHTHTRTQVRRLSLDTAQFIYSTVDTEVVLVKSLTDSLTSTSDEVIFNHSNFQKPQTVYLKDEDLKKTRKRENVTTQQSEGC